jgi:ATP-binding cassette subfamily F protein 3
VDIGYAAGKPVLKNIDLRIAMTDRIALLGANGNGKSTLIKLLSGTLKQLKGDVVRDSKLRVGYFAQHQSDELDMNSTAFEVLRDKLKGTAEPKIRAMLGKFGFDKNKADTKIDELSGGEKARLLFCIMSHDAPHIMLLDEPTNHLDIDARQALIQALNGYEGCVILVSHDPHLVEAVADQLLLVKDGMVTPYNDDLEGYRKLIIQQRRDERSEARREGKAKKSGKSKALKAAEQALVKLTGEKKTIEQELESEKALSHPKLMADLLSRYATVQQELEAAEAEWLALSEVEE